MTCTLDTSQSYNISHPSQYYIYMSGQYCMYKSLYDLYMGYQPDGFILYSWPILHVQEPIWPVHEVLARWIHIIQLADTTCTRAYMTCTWGTSRIHIIQLADTTCTRAYMTCTWGTSQTDSYSTAGQYYMYKNLYDLYMWYQPDGFIL